MLFKTWCHSEQFLSSPLPSLSFSLLTKNRDFFSDTFSMLNKSHYRGCDLAVSGPFCGGLKPRSGTLCTRGCQRGAFSLPHGPKSVLPMPSPWASILVLLLTWRPSAPGPAAICPNQVIDEKACPRWDAPSCCLPVHTDARRQREPYHFYQGRFSVLLLCFSPPALPPPTSVESYF